MHYQRGNLTICLSDYSIIIVHASCWVCIHSDQEYYSDRLAVSTNTYMYKEYIYLSMWCIPQASLLLTLLLSVNVVPVCMKLSTNFSHICEEVVFHTVSCTVCGTVSSTHTIKESVLQLKASVSEW